MPELDVSKFQLTLMDTLGRLAMPAADQTAYLERLGVDPWADELALEFDACWVPLSAYWRETGESRELHAACADVNAALNTQTGWTFDDLTSESWTHIRQLASRAVPCGPSFD